MLTDNAGKWIGNKEIGGIDNQILFKRNIRFPSAGTYLFKFEQGMRTDALEYINCIGLRVEKSG